MLSIWQEEEEEQYTTSGNPRLVSQPIGNFCSQGGSGERGVDRMGYIEQNLIAGEKVVYQTRLHWIIFAWPAVFLVIALFSLLGREGGAGGFFLIVGLLWGLSS